MLNLPRPPMKYDVRDASEVRQSLEREDRANFKKGQDVRLAQGERLILYSPNGTAYVVGVDNAGSLTVTAE